MATAFILCCDNVYEDFQQQSFGSQRDCRS